MSESNKKTLRTITTVLVCLAIVFAFFISIIRVFGFKVYGVLTGSMEPAYPTGSLIYVRDVDPNTLRIGDVITFSLSPNVIATHRIVDIVPDESNPNLRRFQTKGDANNSVDASLVNPTHIIGKVAFSIPYLGDIANYIQNPPGTYVAILISGVLIFLVFMTDAAASDKFKFLQKKEPQQQQPLPAGYPAGQQLAPYPQGYPQQPPAAYPPQQAMQQAPGAYPRQTDPRYNTQQPAQNGYLQQPQHSDFPQPQQQAGSYPYRQPFPSQQPQYPQQSMQQPYQSNRQVPPNGYRAQQPGGYIQQQPVQPPQQMVPPQQQGYQRPVQQPAANGYTPAARPSFQTGGFVSPQQNDGAQRRRRSNSQTMQ